MFQKQAYIQQALGKEGTIARLNPVTKLPMIAEADVVAGGFGFKGTDPERQVKGTDALATAPEGVVVFEKYTLGASLTNDLKIPAGEEVALVKKGYVFVKSTTTAENGQIVGVDPATGTIGTYNDAGSLPSATAGSVTYAEVDYNDFTGISAGDLAFKVDGVTKVVSSVDLSAVASLADLVSALDTAVTADGVTVTASGTSVVFTSDATGAGTGVELLSGSIADVFATYTATEVAGTGAFIDTGWKVQTGAPAGQVCEIFNI